MSQRKCIIDDLRRDVRGWTGYTVDVAGKTVHFQSFEADEGNDEYTCMNCGGVWPEEEWGAAKAHLEVAA